MRLGRQALDDATGAPLARLPFPFVADGPARHAFSFLATFFERARRYFRARSRRRARRRRRHGQSARLRATTTPMMPCLYAHFTEQASPAPLEAGIRERRAPPLAYA